MMKSEAKISLFQNAGQHKNACVAPYKNSETHSYLQESHQTNPSSAICSHNNTAGHHVKCWNDGTCKRKEQVLPQGT